MKVQKLVDKLRERLQEQRGSWRQLAASQEGLDYSWMQKFGYGAITNPTVGKLMLLEKALKNFKGKESKTEDQAA